MGWISKYLLLLGGCIAFGWMAWEKASLPWELISDTWEG